MPDDAEVSGIVLGAPGDLVAGWAKIGERGTRNTFGETVTIRTDDGREVKLEKIEGATLGPVVKRTAPWIELEMDVLWALCLTE
ncbi:MAG: hypothetical protein H0T42_26300, partial [Deltaproteobacteria bacterium]|nr:hypothetical protein [Deltaproteobacteria bacterium]